MIGKLTKTEKLLLLLSAIFLAVLLGLYLRPSTGADYTVTAQYELEEDMEETDENISSR